MSPDEKPASGPPSGGSGEGPRTRPATPEPSAAQVREEEARRMRSRVQQQTASDEASTSRPGRESAAGEGPASAGASSRSGAPQSGRAPGGTSASGSSSSGSGVQEGRIGRKEPQEGRRIASASVSAPRKSEAKRPVITGVAAARLLGKEEQGAGNATGSGSETDTGSTDASMSRIERKGGATDKPKRTSGIDEPTSHIDRSGVSVADMPDLASVRHPAPAEAHHEPETHARTAVTVGRRRGRGPLRAAMQLRSVDPWSALKVSLIVSVAMFLVWMIAVAIIYVVLDGMGVWDRLNTGVTDIISDNGDNAELIGPGQVFGVAAILGIINIVLFTALSTLGAFIYNLSSDMVGGVEVTLADRD